MTGLKRRGGNRKGNESGQGLGYVLIVGTVLLIFLVALADLLMKEMKWVVGAGKRNVLLHAADSAVDRAMYALQVAGNWDSIPAGEVAGYQEDFVYSDVPGVAYTIRVEEGNWTPGVQMGDLDLERTITIFASNTLTGERKKVQAVILKSSLNSALFADGNIKLEGHVDVYWGPVVSYSTASDTMTLDSPLAGHPIYISRGGILIGGTPATSLGMDASYPMAGQSVNEYATESELGPAPTIPLEEYKSVALALESAGKGDFYKYDGSTSYSSVFPTGMTEETVVFFDTCNGDPFVATNTNPTCPAAGSGLPNGVDVTISSNPCGQGVLVVLGDMHVGGTSCGVQNMIPPPNCYDMLDAHPDCCGIPVGTPVYEDQLFWEGFAYIAGKFFATGNKKFYGSVYAGAMAADTGNITIWFKSSNKSMGYLGKTVFVKLWMERRPEPGDSFP